MTRERKPSPYASYATTARAIEMLEEMFKYRHLLCRIDQQFILARIHAKTTKNKERQTITVAGTPRPEAFCMYPRTAERISELYNKLQTIKHSAVPYPEEAIQIDIEALKASRLEQLNKISPRSVEVTPERIEELKKNREDFIKTMRKTLKY